MSMSEAVGETIADGSSIALGLGLEALIPFAAGHEIIRKRRRDLTLIGPISDILFDQLIGAGCVERICAAWVGNVSAGLGHCYRRAAERGEPRSIEVRDHSNFTMAMALLAGSLGAPFLPTKTLLGSDVPATNPALHEGVSPLSGERLIFVEALVPDIAIVHAQRADETGGCHAWGNLGVMEDAAQAASRVIVVAEEIVSRDVISSDPNRVLTPPQKVCAVVHAPGGAHPSPVQGFWGRDHEFYKEYHAATKTLAGFDEWRAAWVDGVADREQYLNRLGADRVGRLRVRGERLAAPVNYSAS
jgi:glutaconate CoA-transferase subunit A